MVGVCNIATGKRVAKREKERGIAPRDLSSTVYIAREASFQRPLTVPQCRKREGFFKG